MRTQRRSPTRRRRAVVWSIAAAAVTLLSLRLVAQRGAGAAPADLLILNGRVYAAGTVHDAIAIWGNTIVGVGRAQELERLRGPRTEVMDARARSVVPGFNDSHVHFLSGGLGLRDVNLAGVATLREVQARIRLFAQAKPDEPWVRGRGWLYSAFPGGLPTAAQLNQIVPDRPAVMVAYDGHTTWVNSKALQAAGITGATPDPVNGIIVKDSKTGEPTGVLKEAAQSLLNRVVPRPTDDDRRSALRAAVAEANRLGVTSIQNASGSADELTLYAAAKAAGDLTSGTPNYSAAELDRIIAMMDKRGWQIEVHAIGDRTIRMTLDAFARAIAANPAPPRGRRHRIEHIETIDAADIPRFGSLGVIASQQPMHVVLGDMNSLKPSGPWPDNLGPERASRAWNWKSIRDAGGRLTFGSDWAVAPLDPLQGIWVVTTRLTPPGMRDQKLPIALAIDGYTAWPAYASFDEQRKGTLVPGMLADVVVLSRDIFAQPPATATDVVVDVTIFDGHVVYRRQEAR